jgi:putative PIG3 family NAD(P)H quinone oxidoreductase
VKAITFEHPGAPDVLEVTALPDPAAGAGQVVIDVAAAGVNRSDLMERAGGFYPPKGRTLVGLECSGLIAAVGAGVAKWKVGDAVCALLNEGGYAEKVVAQSSQVLSLPVGVDLIDAAGIMEVAATVISNFDIAGLKRGDTLLIHGGAGGIGTMAIQIAHAMGLIVIVTVGSDEKAEFCKQLGADHAIMYRTEDFVEKVKRVTADRGADVILDNMGAAYLARNIDALALDGRLVIIGFQGGTNVEFDLRSLWLKRGSLHATALRTRPLNEKAEIVERVKTAVWPLLENGKARPVTYRRVPLEEAAEAHRILEKSEHIGKVLLVTGLSEGVS